MRPEHITNLIDDMLFAGLDEGKDWTDIEDYIKSLEKEVLAQRRRAQTASQMRDIEEIAFQRRLAELKATQVVKVVHGGRIS